MVGGLVLHETFDSGDCNRHANLRIAADSQSTRFGQPWPRAPIAECSMRMCNRLQAASRIRSRPMADGDRLVLTLGCSSSSATTGARQRFRLTLGPLPVAQGARFDGFERDCVTAITSRVAMRHAGLTDSEPARVPRFARDASLRSSSKRRPRTTRRRVRHAAASRSRLRDRGPVTVAVQHGWFRRHETEQPR